MSRIYRSIQEMLKTGGWNRAKVISISGGRVSIRVSGTGAIYHDLGVIGVVTSVGQDVRVDLTAHEPIVLAVGPPPKPKVTIVEKALAMTNFSRAGNQAGSVVNNTGWIYDGGRPLWMNGILVDNDGTSYTNFTPDVSGLLSAIAATSPGGSIYIPGGSYDYAFTIPPNIRIVGMSSSAVRFTQLFTAGSGTCIENVTISVTGSGNQNLAALLYSGSVILKGCNIFVTRTSGVGRTCCVKANSSGSELYARECGFYSSGDTIWGNHTGVLTSEGRSIYSIEKRPYTSSPYSSSDSDFGGNLYDDDVAGKYVMVNVAEGMTGMSWAYFYRGTYFKYTPRPGWPADPRLWDPPYIGWNGQVPSYDFYFFIGPYGLGMEWGHIYPNYNQEVDSGLRGIRKYKLSIPTAQSIVYWSIPQYRIRKGGMSEKIWSQSGLVQVTLGFGSSETPGGGSVRMPNISWENIYNEYATVGECYYPSVAGPYSGFYPAWGNLGSDPPVGHYFFNGDPWAQYHRWWWEEGQLYKNYYERVIRGSDVAFLSSYPWQYVGEGTAFEPATVYANIIDSEGQPWSGCVWWDGEIWTGTDYTGNPNAHGEPPENVETTDWDVVNYSTQMIFINCIFESVPGRKALVVKGNTTAYAINCEIPSYEGNIIFLPGDRFLFDSAGYNNG
jgi:hypothetical protein